MHPDPPTPRLSASERAGRVRFRRAVTLMLMTLVAPGSAQLVTGNRRLGLVALRIWGALLGVGVLVALASLARPGLALSLASNTTLLGWLRLLLMAGAIGWFWLFVDAWRLGQPLTLQQQRQRLTVAGVNGFLCFTVAGSLLFGAHLVGVQRDFLQAMFSDSEASGAHDGRFNVLLLGGDSGAGRWGLRTDSVTVASVDAETGRTVLISLPRNMANFPFREGSVMDKQFPDGFDCEDCYLNGVSTWAEDHTELFGRSATPGIDATVMAAEGITGLRINYWAMVNLQGFRSLVDAFGGVTLNVRDRIPVGLPSDSYFHYIEPGIRKLNGQETLWFARARYGSDDYSRMARQKCVMSAMLRQVSPQTAVRNFQEIAAASSDMVSTNLPRSEVARFVDLAMKARALRISTVSLVPPAIDTADPDLAVVRRLVADGIARAEGRTPAPVPADPATPADPGTPAPAPGTPQPAPPTQAPPTQDPGEMTGGSKGSMHDGYVANQSDDLAAAC